MVGQGSNRRKLSRTRGIVGRRRAIRRRRFPNPAGAHSGSSGRASARVWEEYSGLDDPRKMPDLRWLYDEECRIKQAKKYVTGKVERIWNYR